MVEPHESSISMSSLSSTSYNTDVSTFIATDVNTQENLSIDVKLNEVLETAAFDEWKSDLYRLYTKEMKDSKNILRLEHQESPNQTFADAMVRNLYPEGHLIVPGEDKNARIP